MSTHGALSALLRCPSLDPVRLLVAEVNLLRRDLERFRYFALPGLAEQLVQQDHDPARLIAGQEVMSRLFPTWALLNRTCALARRTTAMHSQEPG